MTVFRVWAPNARNVEVQVGLGRVPMAAQDQGWWQVDVPQAGPGSDYSFVLDGGEPRPDPRSPWQPYGVHGPSRVVDHSAFSWTDERWQAGPLPRALIYELHVGTFTPKGTFESAISRLDYLVELGVTHVELMPVNEFAGSRGWGYDGVQLYAPYHVYGGPQGLKRLVDACHRKGVAVILDVVYNHMGAEGNYLAEFGPYFTDRYSTPWGRAVNLDGAYSDPVRRFILDNALMWLRDYHVDGLRVDAIGLLYDRSAIHILEEMAREMRTLEIQIGRRLVLIAESDINDPRVVQTPEIGGYGLDAQWSDDFHHALHTVLTGERSGYYQDYGEWWQLAKALQQAFVVDGCYSPFRKHRYGRSAAGVPGYRFVGFLQNHDQIGNRAAGERIGFLLDDDLLKAAAALVLTAPFVPMLFQGEEWSASTPFLFFSDYQEPQLGRAVREGRRKDVARFGWDSEQSPDPQAVETFERSRLDWNELEQEPHASLLDWYRQLIRLRLQTPALLDGDLEQVQASYDLAAGWFAVQRGPLLIVSNLAEQAQQVTFDRPREGRILLASAAGTELTVQEIWLPPHSVAVVAPADLTRS